VSVDIALAVILFHWLVLDLSVFSFDLGMLIVDFADGHSHDEEVGEDLEVALAHKERAQLLNDNLELVNKIEHFGEADTS